MTFKVDDRIYETSVTTGTGDYVLDGAPAGYQPVSVIGANNHSEFWVTDGVNWESLIGKYITGPSRLVRETIKASSNGGAAVNWGAGTKNIRCGRSAWRGAPRKVTKSVAGGTDVTLTQDEMRCDVLELTGAITANISVFVDATVWQWVVLNSTSGAFTLTLKVSGQTGVVVTQAKSKRLYCDGVDVKDGYTDISVTTPLPRSYLAGYGLANNSADATNDIDVAVGACRDSGDTANIVLSSALTKQLDAAWAVGNNAGMLDTGAVGNNTYHIYAIRRSDTGVVDILASLSESAPTMPANYDQKRRIGSILRESGSIVAFVQDGHYFRRKASVLDINVTNPGTAAVTRTLSVPNGINVFALTNTHFEAADSQTNGWLLSDLAANDQAPSRTLAPLSMGFPNTTVNERSAVMSAIRTNTSRQIRSSVIASDGSTVLRIATLGWIDRRGRDS